MEAKRLGLLGQTSTLRSLLEDARKASDQRTALFRRPAALETGRLASEAWKASGVAREYRGANTLLRSDMLKAKTAWLDRSDPARSLKAFADLVGLGRGLRTTSPYDQGLTDALRSSFGDWRDEMSRPMAVMVVPLARTVLYRDLGFDPGLIDFPAPAFDKVLQRHGMGFVDAAWDEDDDGGHGLASCERAARAFVRLRRFEVKLRKLIVRAMTNAFGEKWMLWLPPRNGGRMAYEAVTVDQGGPAGKGSHPVRGLQRLQADHRAKRQLEGGLQADLP